jgi:membrane-associated phospholipid phosphatase
VWRETLRTVSLRVFLQWGGIIVAVGVALSRVALGVHWFSDVYVGMGLAMAWVAIWYGLFRNSHLFSLDSRDQVHRYQKE